MCDTRHSEKRCTKCGEIKPFDAFYRDKKKKDGLTSHCKACQLASYHPVKVRRGNSQTEKYCPQCGQTKPLDAFSSDKTKKNGLDSYCRACKAIYRAAHRDRKLAWDTANADKLRAYRAENVDKLREYNHAYHAANADKIRIRKSSYRAANADKIRASSAAYRAANVGKYREYHIVYQAANAEKLRAYNAAYRTANPEVYRAASSRRRALKKLNGGTFTASELALMRTTQGGICAYCQYQYDPDHLQMDHIIPLAQGGRHESANICLACPKCNLSEWNRTPDQWQNRWYYRQTDPYAEQIFGRWNE